MCLLSPNYHMLDCHKIQASSELAMLVLAGDDIFPDAIGFLGSNRKREG